MKFFMTTLCLIGSLGLFGQTTIDFTDPSTPTHGSNAQKNVNGVMLMWAGDLNGDGIISYTGNLNNGNSIEPDSPILLSTVLNASGNNFTTRTYTFQQYSSYDLNLDGVVSYSGTLFNGNTIVPDNGTLLGYVLNGPNNVFITRTYTFKQQIP